jgi:excisionase family DNA binding protein
VSAHEEGPPDARTLADAIAERLVAKVGELQTAQRFLTVGDAASYTGLSQDTIRALLAGRKLTPLHPVRGRIVIDRRELDTFILSSTRRPAGGRGQRRHRETDE